MRGAGRVAGCCLTLAAACSHPHSVSDAGLVRDGGTADAGDAGDVADAGPLVCSQSWTVALGYPCNTDSDCETLHCAFPFPSSFGATTGVCSTTCANPGATDECPQWPLASATCQQAFTVTINAPSTLFQGDYCLPNAGSTLPGDHSLPAGSPCGSNADCAGTGALCAAYNYGEYEYSFCAPECGGTTDAGCGECESCGHPFNLQEEYCLFTGPEPVGSKCVHHSDCSTFRCEHFCTRACSATLPCPAGSICERIDPSGGGGALCVDPAQIGSTPNSGGCQFDFECLPSSQCLYSPTSGADVCTPIAALGGTCTSSDTCADGLDCRQFAASAFECTEDCGIGYQCAPGQTCVAPVLPVTMRLYNTPDAGPFGTLAGSITPTDGGAWAELVYPATPGQYWIGIGINPSTYPNGYTGTYQLALSDGSGTPMPWQSLPNAPVPHDTTALAQPVPFPVDISGALQSPTETDYYTFFLPNSATITATASSGPPTACLPTTQVGTKGLGLRCAESFNCATGLFCDSTLNVCTQSCSTDADCSTGFLCENVSTLSSPTSGNECVASTKAGAVADGSACLFDWQCAAASTCIVAGTMVTVISATTISVCASACGTTESCSATTGCALAPDLDTGVFANACLPEGKGNGAFGSACNLQSNCATGLTCTQGYCGQSCQADGDCPGRPFAPDPIVCTPCIDDTPCTTATEEDYCTPLGGNERYCLQPCRFNTDCTPGFTCLPESPTGADFQPHVCVPVDGSCRAPTCQIPALDGGPAAGSCNVPNSSFAEPCAKDSDCATSSCVSNCGGKSCPAGEVCGTLSGGPVECLTPAPASDCAAGCVTGETCVSATSHSSACAVLQSSSYCSQICASDADCGCATGDLVCTAGVCGMNPSYVQEQVPDNSFAFVQTLTAKFPITLLGTAAVPDGGSQTGDFYAVTFDANTTVSIATHPVCGTAATGAEVFVDLWSPTHSLLQQGTTGGYGLIHDYAVTTAGTYLIEVEGITASASANGFAYVLTIDSEVTPVMP